MAGIPQVFQTQLTDVSSVRRDPLGSIRYGDGGKVYKYVQFKNFTGTVAAAAGSLVGYVAVANNGYETSLVCAKGADMDAVPICAGAALAAVTGTSGTIYYIWIQVQGIITIDTAVGSGAAGKSFYLTTTDKTATVGAAATDQKAGLCLNATTKVLLTCPL